jgi:hypothetical protein
MLATVFFRTSNRVPGRGRAVTLSVEVPAGADLQTILVAASTKHRVALLSRFGQTGVFEVQTDAGVWAHPDGSERCVLTKGVQFKTWEKLDAESP